MKCVKDYSKSGRKYSKDGEYEIREAQVKEDEKYFGEKLWEGSETQAADDSGDQGADQGAGSDSSAGDGDGSGEGEDNK